MSILVTGSAGFIGRHLTSILTARFPEAQVRELRRDNFDVELDSAAEEAEVVFHLAGVNRPTDPAEFVSGNHGVTARLCQALGIRRPPPRFFFTSSVQAALDNPYGRSKSAAEQVIEEWARATGAQATVLRLKNVFGKWCRPNYNSVVATFCHNVARDLPISISDPVREIELVYIDDVVAELLKWVEGPVVSGYEVRESGHAHRIALGELACLIQSFRASRTTLTLPAFDDEFVRRLYATYVTYLEPAEFGYSLTLRADPRGTLAEFMKSPPFGQIFVSRTKPGVTRGNHYHHTKTEKFLVLEGEAVIRFRRIDRTEVIEQRVSGRDFRVLDIPPGYTHSIENIGDREMVVLFWAVEMFDPARPDTYALPVLTPAGTAS